MLNPALVAILSSFAFDPQAAVNWRAVTLSDVEAAYRLTADNHPGAHEAVADAAFRSRLEEAAGVARVRAEEVTNADGHRAVLGAFGVALGDDHIRYQGETATKWRWSGVLVRQQGASWRVALDEPLTGEETVADAELLSCDGRSPDQIGRERLGGFKIDWSIDAQRVRRGFLMLMDDGNPFLTPLRGCRFKRPDGVTVDRKIAWRELDAEALQTRIAAVYKPARAGMGVRAFAGGRWIALESLGDDARPVVDQVVAEQTVLRAAPMVVLDMRGNGGGASSLGLEIARALLGDAFVNDKVRSSGPCDAVWRASPGNLAAMKTWRNLERGPEYAAWVEESIAALEAAAANGNPLDHPIEACDPETPEPVAIQPVSAMSGRLVLVTDESCFSSCLLVTDAFRKLGAIHVGRTTDAGTRYMEVRSERLPSGLGRFSTLQKVAIGDAVTGPFEPSVIYPGEIGDTPPLEAWIADLH